MISSANIEHAWKFWVNSADGKKNLILFLDTVISQIGQLIHYQERENFSTTQSHMSSRGQYRVILCKPAVCNQIKLATSDKVSVYYFESFAICDTVPVQHQLWKTGYWLKT